MVIVIVYCLSESQAGYFKAQKHFQLYTLPSHFIGITMFNYLLFMHLTLIASSWISSILALYLATGGG